MNPTTDPPQLQPPQPPQPHRPSTSCDRHPDEHFTGFCPSCLCERLAVLDHNSSSLSVASSSSRRPPIIPTTSTATAALKAIFKPSAGGGGNASGSTKPSFFPELRRTKSFSASKNEGFSGVFEPQRRSCDVRVRNTLWSLFNQDDGRNPSRKEAFKAPETEVESRISTSSVRGPVIESKEEEEIETETDYEDGNDENGDIVRVLEEPVSVTARNSNANPIAEIIEEEEEEEPIVIEPEQVQEEEVLNLKPMKDHINLDSQTRKPSSGRDFKEIAGSFWSAASVFSKKLQKWRQKQKSKKRTNVRPGLVATLPMEKPIGRQFRETQSEIADYGFGRRSCDTDPRFSLDVGRISFDDSRYSFDEPRASWDGYLIGRTTFPRMSSTMVSVVEDAPAANVVLRSDTQIPVEEPPALAVPMNGINEDERVPGGSAQTKEYYSDSSSRRRKSLDRSNSIRKTAAAVVAEIDELKSVSNAKVTPATADYFHGQKLVVPDNRDLRDSNSNSLRDDCSATFDIQFGDRGGSVMGNGETKVNKKSRRWSKAFNIWGFIHRRSVNKDEDEDRYSRANGVERSYSESWQDLRGQRNGEVRGSFNPKVLRSNSSVSWRNSNSFGAATFGSARKSNVETNGNGNGRKKREEFVLERNRSARYSPNNIDNGLLRFYLTPMRNSRRAGWGKSKSSQAHSIARSVLRLY